MKAITQYTAGQVQQIDRFLSDAIRKIGTEKFLRELGLDKDELQMAIRNGGEFAMDVRRAAMESLIRLSSLEDFSLEEINSRPQKYSCEYQPGNILSVAEQIQILGGIFPQFNLSPCRVAGDTNKPEGAEGFFVIPPWQSLGKSYYQAVEKVLVRIKSDRGQEFVDSRPAVEVVGLRKTSRTEMALEQFAEKQKACEFLLIPAQLGLRHVGRSMRRTRRVFLENEFGLGIYEIGIILITHPERLEKYGDLDCVCIGDEILENVEGSETAVSISNRVPSFDIHDGKLHLFSVATNEAGPTRGAATGFFT